MRKIIVLTLSCVIVLMSFAFCFADDNGAPMILPVGDVNDVDVGYLVKLPTGDRLYRSDVSPLYMVYYRTEGSTDVTQLFFSDQAGSHFYFNNVGASTGSARTLNSTYNGYYYSSANQNVGDNVSVMVLPDTVTSPTDAIDYIANTVFNVSFDLTYLVDGSVNWLSSMAQAVKTNGLLLFFVLFIFVGVGIGLFKRFSN